jgi:hypothetical protein
MAKGIRVGFDAVRESAFGSILASYSAVGSATADYARLICMSNGTNADVYVSLDNSTNHFRIPANGFKLLDLTANKQSNSQLYLSKGTTFYVKRVSGAPTSGTFWVEVMNGEGGK